MTVGIEHYEECWLWDGKECHYHDWEVDLMPEVPYVPVPEGSMISTDTLHEAVQAHIAQCGQCTAAVAHSGEEENRTNNVQFGKRTKMCGEYLKIVQFFASGETL